MTIAATAPKGHLAGTHRIRSPAETLARVSPLMPVMGITRIANITGLDCLDIPVTMVCRPNARSLAVSQGKGLDLVAAKVSGLMESIEAYHAETITLPLKIATYEELRYTHNVIDVEQLPRTPNGLFHPNLAMAWIEGIDLVHRERIWVPYDVVHVNFTARMRWTKTGFVCSSNGLASGNHLLEAIEHAICEVVERDAVTLWRLLDAEGQARTRIDPTTVDDAACRSVLAKYAAAGIAVGLWECTSDVGVPAFYCRIMDEAEQPFRRLGYADGMGCHPARNIAVLRALTEAAQSRLALIAGSRDDMLRESYLQLRSPDRLDQHRRDLQRPEPMRPFTDCVTAENDSFDADVAWEIDRLRAVGLDRIVLVDLTKPELGIPVARIVVPGLEGLAVANQWAPGKRARARMRGAK
jgi:ribosomal protein S12 methylthiotransferase accessory factor